MEKEITWKVDGMTCSNCALGISNVLKQKGIEEIQVSFATGSVQFTPIDGYSDEAVKRDIERHGYQVIIDDDQGNVKAKPKYSALEKKFAFTALFTLPLLLHMFISAPFLHNVFVQFFLALPVIIVGWSHFAKSAWASLRSGVPNMDVLITIGSGSAMIYSIVGSVLFYGTPQAHHYLFFATAATIITLVLLGNVIEQRSVKETGSAIRQLGALQPDLAIKVNVVDGEEQLLELKSIDIAVGEILLVRTGDRIPVDGVLMKGEGLVDESFLTGESLPVEKQLGSKLTGGTILLEGQLRMQSTSSGREGTLNRIVDLVRKAQMDQPPIQKLGDKISAIFVPAVVGIALLTFLLSYLVFTIGLQSSLMNAIAVLVISCPCAMGLATPTAVMAGLGKAAKEGVLFRSGEAIERMARANMVVFDKTGTLTTGAFRIEKLNIYQESNFSENEVKSFILGLEQNSSHPIAKSLTNELKKSVKPFTFQHVQEIKGLGLRATDETGRQFSIGSAKFHHIEATMADIFLFVDDMLIAEISMKDEVKKDAAELILKLHQIGFSTMILSGDKEERCNAVGEFIGIKHVIANKLPDEKLEIIREWSKSKSIIMVGDGVNDAPSLNLAAVGVSFSEASQIAKSSAQVVLLERFGLIALLKAIRLSQETLKTIKQNLFWAFFYNVLAIPIAAIGLLNPMIAAFSMAFSDVVVIGNSIRLKFKKIR